MALATSDTIANAYLDLIESTTGTSALLRIYAGSVPASTSAGAGTLLAECSLPSDWMAAASSRSKAKSGTWQDLAANATGTAAYFRIYDSGGSTCTLQGTCTLSGGGGDMILDSLSFNVNQQFTVTAFTLTA